MSEQDKQAALDAFESLNRMIDGDAWSCSDAMDFIHEHKQTIRAARAVPEGYALVPLEPTEEMVNEYFDATRITLEGGASGTLAVIEGYRAMIAAAQKGGE